PRSATQTSSSSWSTARSSSKAPTTSCSRPMAHTPGSTPRSSPGRLPRWNELLAAPGEVGDPVRLPGLTAVHGEGLIPARRICSDLRPGVPADDRLPLVVLLAVEAADAVGEAPGHRRQPEYTCPAVDPVQGPVTGRRVEQPHGQAAESLVG